MLPLLIPAIGAGLGLLSGLSNKPQQQFESDPSLQKYLDIVRSLGLDAYKSMPGLGTDFDASMQALRGLSGAGGTASNILLGKDPQAMMQAMGPYMAMMQPVFDRMRGAAATQAKLGATSPFGYGSADADAAQKAMLGVGDQEAGFNYQGFSDMMSRMSALTNLGYSADVGLQQGSMMPMQFQLQRMGLLAPGLTSAGRTTTIPSQFDPFQAMLGGGLAALGAQGGLGKGFTSAGSPNG